MWTRVELKEKAKKILKRNYWLSVLVAMILVFLSGGSVFNSKEDWPYNTGQDTVQNVAEQYDEQHETDAKMSDQENSDWYNAGEQLGQIMGHVSKDVEEAVAMVIVCFVLICLVVIVCLNVFVFDPLLVGCERFFVKNINEKAAFSELGYLFKNHYKNGVKTMFLMGLFNTLWFLLFIIPGIIKSYEYRMIPFLIAVDPQMDTDEIFAKSKQMMDGNKWKTFVLDLSFLGWEFLSLLSFGIVGIFFVRPYRFQTEAVLFEALYKNVKQSENEIIDVYTEI
ncbi:MAG: DUF975 family protein [Eubacteriales bacterium]|nr:DUF975 family protein [Eubacteriales bacterium]